MDQAGAVLDRDVVGEPDVVRFGDVDDLERACVSGVLELTARQLGQQLHGGVGEDLGQQRLRDNEDLVLNPYGDVRDIGVNGDRGVGDQRPGGCRPDEQRGTELGQRSVEHGEAHEDRGVRHFVVALRHLVVGQAGATARAVGRDPVVLDQQALVEDLLERPPDRLDVGRVHRPVGLVEVDPVAHALGEPVELTDVLLHRLAAPGIELGDAVVLDLLLAAGETEPLLDFELDR